MNWNSAFIEQINSRRKQERKSAPETAEMLDNLLKLTSVSLYGEKVHYALELIQNAEDSEASSIIFIFEKEGTVVFNNGEVFTPGDVDAICSVKPGRKKNKIGFFGVGFKSVFNVTRTPQIISSDFNFLIEDYICPKPTSNFPEGLDEYYSKDRGSIFVLPQTHGLPTIPELIENFKEIDEKILLFLNNLKSLHFINRVSNEQWSIEKLPSEGSLISLRNGRTNQITKWQVFHKDLPVSSQEVLIPEEKKGIESTRIVVAFPCDEDTREAIKGSTLYCYLPTKKRTDMPFLVQADFVPTVGRGDIKDIEWNKWLLRKLGELAAEAMDQIKDDELLGKDLYTFIPLKEEVHEPLMSILSESMYEILRSKNIAKTLSHEWKTPGECAIPISPEITKIIFQQDLKSLFGKLLSYSEVELSDRARQILTNLSSSVVGEEELVEFLTKEDLVKVRKPAWFLKAYAFLREIFDVTKKNYDGSFRWDEDKLKLFSKLEKTNFVLTSHGSLVPLKDPNKPDRLICYPQSMDLSEVEGLFTEGELVFLNKHFQLSTITKRKEPDPEEEENRKKTHEFFEGVGVRIYFKQSHVIKDVILPKYSSGKYKEYDDLKLYNLLNYIRLYWPTLESEVKNKKLSEKVFDEIKQTVQLKAYTKKNGEKVTAYMPPGKLYFPKRYGKTEVMEDLFEGLEDIYFLHPYYLNREKTEQKKKKPGRQKAEHTWKKFAEILGVWSSPIVETQEEWVSISGKKEYDWVEKRRSTDGTHEIFGDSFSPHIKSLVEYCSGLKDGEAIRQKMMILWQSLSDNWKSYKHCCTTTYKYSYRGPNTVPISSSSFLIYLKRAEWIPSVDGRFCKPEELFVENKRNRFLLGDTVGFVNLSGSHSFLEDLGVNLEPSIDQVIQHLKEYKKNVVDEKKREVEKFEHVYSFIAEKVSEQSVENEAVLGRIKEEFEKDELVYIPRKDKSWWRPRLVFWRDYSKTFGPLRAYIEHEEKELYPSSIKTFLMSLGAKERPTVKQALEVLEELRQQNDIQTLKKVVTKVYSYIRDQISHGITEDLDWQKYFFLTKKGNFSLPGDAYYEDDEEYSKEFQDSLEFVYLPFSSWVNLLPFLKVAGFKSFSESLSIKKLFDGINEAEGGEAAKIRNALSFVKPYLLNKNLESYERLLPQGIFDSITRMEIYETSKIELNLSLKKDESETITVNCIEKDAYYSEEENRLYVLRGTSLLSGKVAKEVSRIFKGAEKDVFPFLNSVLPKADDEEALDTQLQLFGILEESSYSGPEEVELLPEEERKTDQKETDEGPKEETKEKERERPTVKPPTTAPLPKTGLIDPNDFIFEDVEERTPYVKTDGTPNIPTRVIKLREGRPGGQKKEYAPRQVANRFDSHDVALELAMRFEEDEEREPENRHPQKGIGYDIYSKAKDGEEFFIEVKGLGGESGSWELTSTEWKKAEQEKEKYFVYVVKRLRGESGPIIEIIQNPVKYLTPDPPIQKKFSDWENGVSRTIKLSKI